MFLIIGFSTDKQMLACLEEIYLQVSKDKEYQLKQQLQAIILGSKSINEYIKKFKGTCDILRSSTLLEAYEGKYTTLRLWY